MENEYYPEMALPLKPLNERKNDMPCWELEDINLESLKSSVESMAVSGGCIPVDSEDTAFDVGEYLSREYVNLNISVNPSPWCPGFYLIKFKNKGNILGD